MSSKTFLCVGCDKPVGVESSDDTARCPHCGTQHQPPWENPAVVSSPNPNVEEGDRRQREDAAGEAETQNRTASITVEPPVTITITVEVE